MPPINTLPPEAAADEIHSCLPVPAVYPLTKRFRFGWILEVFFIVGVAMGHDVLRNAVMGSAKDALRNAQHVIAFERWLGIYHERAVQQFFINDVGPVAIGMWNFYFETAHFLVPVVVAVYLYRKFPPRYVRMRNTFLIMLFATAPVVWGVFPVTPPKYIVGAGNAIPASGGSVSCLSG
jgi:PAP2 superfamily